MSDLIDKSCDYLLDLLFPVECLGCGVNREELPADERWICPKCQERMNLRAEQMCPFCQNANEGGRTHRECRSKTHLDGLWTACYYDPLIEEAVHRLKFDFLEGIAHPLGLALVRSLLEAAEYGDLQDMLMRSRAKEDEEGVYEAAEKDRPREALLSAVPLHPRRYAWRGFNQSELIARPMAAGFGMPLSGHILTRILDTKPQSKTESSRERRENIRGAFACPDPAAVAGRDVVLVDDICTTSATLDECARTLKEAGAGEVWGLVIARR